MAQIQGGFFPGFGRRFFSALVGLVSLSQKYRQIHAKIHNRETFVSQTKSRHANIARIARNARFAIIDVPSIIAILGFGDHFFNPNNPSNIFGKFPKRFLGFFWPYLRQNRAGQSATQFLQ